MKGLKIAQKALYKEGCLNYLQLEFRAPCSYSLRSSAAVSFIVPRESDAFQSTAGGRSFTSLLRSARNFTDYFSSVKIIKNFLFQIVIDV